MPSKHEIVGSIPTEGKKFFLSVAARWLRTRPIRIDGVEDTPKTVVVDTLIKDLLADCARHRVANTALVASLTGAEDIHGRTPKKPKIS